METAQSADAAVPVQEVYGEAAEWLAGIGYETGYWSKRIERMKAWCRRESGTEDSRFFRAMAKICDHGLAITGSSSSVPATTSLRFAASAIAARPIVSRPPRANNPQPTLD